MAASRWTPRARRAPRFSSTFRAPAPSETRCSSNRSGGEVPLTAQPRPAASKPSLALIGFMGSGKSVVGALVAYRARAPFFDLDFMIESEAGMTIPEIFARRGEAAFRILESRLLPDALKGGAVAALGGGTVMDDANWQLVRQRSMPVY